MNVRLTYEEGRFRLILTAEREVENLILGQAKAVYGPFPGDTTAQDWSYGKVALKFDTGHYAAERVSALTVEIANPVSAPKEGDHD